MIVLPVSLGEAIDKLTILDIKQNKIHDHRKQDVITEFTLLSEKLKDFLNYPKLYNSMKKVNLLIWDMMDELRDTNIDKERYFYLCKETIELNDVRFRVKNKINYISDSLLKEQKSYKIKQLCVKIQNCNSQNYTELFIEPIMYCSFYYDEIIIICEDHHLMKTFSYDPCIRFCKECPDTDCKKLTFKNDLSYDQILTLFELTSEKIKTIC
jgi:hypothetical protein